RREVLSRAMGIADEADVPARGTVRIGHEAAEAIINTVEQEDSDAVLMGWRGRPRRRRDVVLGSNVDRVVTDARCDVLVERMGDVGGIESIFVPTAGGPHAEYAAEIAGAIARGSDITVELASVLAPAADEDAREDAEDLLATAAESVGDHDAVESTLLDGEDIVDTIVERS